MQILTLAVDPHRPFGNAQHTFDARHRRQPGPLQQGDGVKDRFRVEDPTAGLIALAAVKVAAPALVFRQAKGGETGCWRMAMGVLRARRQWGGVAPGVIKQGQVAISLGRLHLAAIAAPALPPVYKRLSAFGRFPIAFIGHDDIRRRQLVAKVVVVDRFLVQ